MSETVSDVDWARLASVSMGAIGALAYMGGLFEKSYVKKERRRRAQKRFWKRRVRRYRAFLDRNVRANFRKWQQDPKTLKELHHEMPSSAVIRRQLDAQVRKRAFP